MFASITTLLEAIVDYAGLFPPAKLALPEAMANYTQYRMSPHAWMLGRFILPLSRLDEFETLLPSFPLKHWSLSIILSKTLEADLEKIKTLFNKDQYTIASLEFPVLLITQIEQIFSHLPKDIEIFFEIPLNEDLNTYIDTLQQTGASAKIRTGGMTIDAFISINQLCQAILSFAKASVPFKATAGLHHPLRAEHFITYEPDSTSTVMHGFLNVAVLAALVYWQKITPEEAREILKESSVNGFQFHADKFSWHNHHLTLVQLQEARQKFFRSFGSCSFSEPINDLKGLKLF